ncbi:hypothetical protein V8E55_008494, partial [Tylopilus felleus]
KNAGLQLWDSSRIQVMVCISVFQFGVDRPNVHFIVISNTRHSLLMTMQMAGQAKRDGRKVHVFLATLEQLPLFQEKNDSSFVSELGQLIHQQTCRVYQVMHSMD